MTAPRTTAPGTTANANAAPPWFDPGWLIWRTLDAGLDDRPGSAEDALLAWIVRLPSERDPAEAAGAVLDRYADGLGDPGATRLTALLEETQSYTRTRLAAMGPGRRRRAPTTRSTGETAR